MDADESLSAMPERGLTPDQAIADLRGSDPGARYYAAWWLGRFRVKDPEAIASLVAALRDTVDRSPDGGYPLRRNAARALGKLEEVSAVPALLDCLDCEDFYVREAAAQSLGTLGDRRAVAPLMALLAGGMAAAQPIPGCPHLAQPYDATLEALGMLGATEAVPLIKPFLAHPLALVQYAAARALYQLTGEDDYGDRLVAALGGDQLQLRRAALADLGAIGYLPAAAAIAETLAENSLKLIALKGLLEAELQRHPGLSPAAVQVMQLMDGLL
ncbi:HEAT repeat domain-containing protein [Lyngbya confervoides]|uniref:HEAT repeat domain-containing protein n=1 Tax=Lyngbya confervoides BDU141951 TaxID=1574623 RepID=A0ABD4T186_9CYAN|nr:HEAT repeat domain-containing protein [Lyngbya confervoides]MCM1982342.1 HEAT repeat domain-containing protein [Lyngbya confervoides BDU141951]